MTAPPQHQLSHEAIVLKAMLPAGHMLWSHGVELERPVTGCRRCDWHVSFVSIPETNHIAPPQPAGNHVRQGRKHEKGCSQAVRHNPYDPEFDYDSQTPPTMRLDVSGRSDSPLPAVFGYLLSQRLPLVVHSIHDIADSIHGAAVCVRVNHLGQYSLKLVWKPLHLVRQVSRRDQHDLPLRSDSLLSL